MIRPLIGSAAMAVLIGFGTIAPALAAPPTVIPSPGYDRRLIESRKALGNPYYDERPVVVAPRGHRNHERRYGQPRHRR